MLARIRVDQRGAPLESADRQLDATHDAIDRDPPPGTEHRRLTAAVGYLRQLDLATVTMAEALAHEVTYPEPENTAPRR